MARTGRRRDEEISVAELLRETGATPRSLGEAPGTSAAREEDTGDGYRERLEQRAREAAAHQQRAGRRIRWISALGGAAVVVGSLVLIAVTSESAPGRQTATVADSLAPATTTPRSTTPVPKPAPTPIPTVLRQTASATTAPPSTTPTPTATPVLCTVRYSVTDQWNDGFTANVTVTNKSGETRSPWTLTWTFTAGQHVTHSWDGDFAQNGDRVTITAASYNATLAPGATVGFGFNGASGQGNPAPAAFALNGARCSPA
ncbi:hypothetical protein H4696_000224 [Amycolatopsis lexingtonensis]|uniref:CBM2 domain-containing protein n=1 Tax=Amycolatopsis lexingtonensis TaxID=218822 RepID=A0ABR9HQC3_9PSEU|nr:cellulose binding domain-containing protein [Amycolatopsis lexingtonensis]MBE1493124.1 hypothetical protein [Amycolatopsis lexingtonensis]